MNVFINTFIDVSKYSPTKDCTSNRYRVGIHDQRWDLMKYEPNTRFVTYSDQFIIAVL